MKWLLAMTRKLFLAMGENGVSLVEIITELNTEMKLYNYDWIEAHTVLIHINVQKRMQLCRLLSFVTCMPLKGFGGD